MGNMPIVRLLDAEHAHNFAVTLASFPIKPLVPRFTTKTQDIALLETHVWDVVFPSPIGLAAGFDKHAQCMDGMLKMGFGFVEVGSVTPLAQDGNAKPRNFRLLEDDAVINRYGFNSYGHAYAKENLSKFRSGDGCGGVVGVNLGKNKLSTDAVNDYVSCVLELGEHADYLVVNISSPNTP